MQTLLSKAKSVKIKGRSAAPNLEMAHLSVAWACGEVTLKQTAAALERTGNSMYSLLANGLRDAVKIGLLTKAPTK